MLAWAWGPVSDRPEDESRVYLKDIALATNQVVDEQNRQMGDDGEDDEKDGKGGKKSFKSSSRGVAKSMKTYLNLKTIRCTDGTPEYKGTNYFSMAMEEERVRGLCERWAVEWKERGSVARSQVIDIFQPSEGLNKKREEWKNTKFQGEE